MANSLCGGDLGVLAGEINSFFESVCRDLDPIDASIVPLDCPVPLNYTIDTDTVIKLLAKINVNKAIGPDDIPSWILRDHALILAHPVCTILYSTHPSGRVSYQLFGNQPMLSLFQKPTLLVLLTRI